VVKKVRTVPNTVIYLKRSSVLRDRGVTVIGSYGDQIRSSSHPPLAISDDADTPK
jgi:hypothetical protein